MFGFIWHIIKFFIIPVKFAFFFLFLFFTAYSHPDTDSASPGSTNFFKKTSLMTQFIWGLQHLGDVTFRVMYSDAWQQGRAQETYSRTGGSGLDFAWPLVLSLATHSRRHPCGACRKWRPSDRPTEADPLHQKLTFIKSPEHAKHMGVCEVLFQTMVWIEETTSSTGVSLPSVEAWGGDEQGGSSENKEGHGHH